MCDYLVDSGRPVSDWLIKQRREKHSSRMYTLLNCVLQLTLFGIHIEDVNKLTNQLLYFQKELIITPCVPEIGLPLYTNTSGEL